MYKAANSNLIRAHIEHNTEIQSLLLYHSQPVWAASTSIWRKLQLIRYLELGNYIPALIPTCVVIWAAFVWDCRYTVGWEKFSLDQCDAWCSLWETEGGNVISALSVIWSLKEWRATSFFVAESPLFWDTWRLCSCYKLHLYCTVSHQTKIRERTFILIPDRKMDY